MYVLIGAQRRFGMECRRARLQASLKCVRAGIFSLYLEFLGHPFVKEALRGFLLVRDRIRMNAI
jgi:hypothetical protein